MKTAIIIGATGLVGGHLLHLLLKNPDYSSVKIFVRKTVGFNHPKLTEHIIDFSQPDTWKDLVVGDVLFSALGTTLKKAGSKEKQYLIDFTYQYQFGDIAAKNEVAKFLLVSSSGADAHSNVFYMKMKGELERAVEVLNFETIFFARPNLLIGDRAENRVGEKLGESVLKFFNSIGLLKSYTPIKGEAVARALINVSLSEDKGVYILPSEELQELSEKNNV